MSMSLERNIPRLYAVQVLSNAQFHLVVYTLFLLGKGFTTQQFFLIEAAASLVMLLMEVPTGVISDRWSRKWTLVLASLVGLPVVPVIILSDSFVVVMLAMSVGGLSMALVSGTDTAILYDTLAALDLADDYPRIAGRMAWYGSLAMAVSGMAGGLLAQADMAYAWWAYFGSGVLALFAKLTVQEPPFHRDAPGEASYFRHLGQSFRLSMTGEAGYFVWYAAGIWFFFSIGFWLWQPYLQLIALPVSLFGFLYAALNLVSGYVSRQAHHVEHRIGMRAALLVIPLMLVAAFVLESQVVFALGFLFLFLQAVASGLFGPLLNDYINRRIPSSRRATVLSIKNMLNSVLFMVLSPLVGYLVDRCSLTAALLLLGLALAVLALIFFQFYRRGGDTVRDSVWAEAPR